MVGKSVVVKGLLYTVLQMISFMFSEDYDFSIRLMFSKLIGDPSIIQILLHKTLGI